MKINIKKVLLNVYISLFIFCMINREFLLFGLDLRFILVPLGILLIGVYILTDRGVTRIKHGTNFKQFKLLILFYLWVFLSNISWIWNGLPMDQTKLINELILLANVFISIIVIMLYESEITSSYINKNIVISGLILVISIVLVGMGFTAEQLSSSVNEPIKYETANGIVHTNLFGWNFRPAGYASDPNYATLLMLIACACVMKLTMTKIKKAILIFPFLLGIALAFSKTILAATFFAILFIGFLKYIIKNKEKAIQLTKILLILLIIISVATPFISELRNILPQTLTTRLFLWENAVKLFVESPLIGNGITSFRSYLFIDYNWFVQAHNTYVQILSETGIVGIVLFYFLMSNTIKNNYNNVNDFFMTIVFMMFLLTNESIALQFFLYVMLFCQIGRKENLDDSEKEKSLVHGKHT